MHRNLSPGGHVGANTTKTAKNKRKKGKTHSSTIGLMLPELFIPACVRVWFSSTVLSSFHLVFPSPSQVTIAQASASIINSERRCRSTAWMIWRYLSYVATTSPSWMSIVKLDEHSHFHSEVHIQSCRISNAKAYTTISCPFQDITSHLEQLSCW